MALWKRGRRYWTQVCQWRADPTAALPTRVESCDDELAGGHAAREGPDSGRAGGQARRHRALVKLFDAVRRVPRREGRPPRTRSARSNSTVSAWRSSNAYFGDVRLSASPRELIEGFQAKRRLEGASNRTVNMDVGALRQVSEAVQAVAPA